MQRVGVGPPKGVMIVAILTVAGIGLAAHYRAQIKNENRDRVDRGSNLVVRSNLTVVIPPKGG